MNTAKQIIENLEFRYRSAVRVRKSRERLDYDGDKLSPLDLAIAHETEAWNALQASVSILNGEKS